MNNALELYDDLIKECKIIYESEPKDDKNDSWKQKYDFKNLRNLEYQPVKLETISLSDENKSDLKQPMQPKQLKLSEIQKHLWVKSSRQNFNSSIKDVVNNLYDGNYKTYVNNRTYDLKNAEKVCRK